MKTGSRAIASGVEYDHLFPRAEGRNIVWKKNGKLKDTVGLMKRVIAFTQPQTKRIAEELRAETIEKTCRKIWNFTFKHLQYRKDEDGKEQVRSPARSWSDRKIGLDCDCMTVFIGAILMSLKINNFSIRLTRYESDSFEHVYPVVHTPNGVIIMDCVVHQYNYEVPYTEKQDIKMDLEFLNGFGDEDEFSEFEYLDGTEDDFDFIDDDDLEGLEGKEARQQKRAEKKQIRKATPLKQKVAKGLHVINRVNPATALLRAGVLACMKINFMKVASKLRYAYWTESQATQNNMDVSKYRQLVKIKEKLEKIFFGAGGKPENLKKSILTGRGNRNKKVTLNGLGAVINYSSNSHDLIDLIGNDTYYDEFSQVSLTKGVNGLGEPVTATASIAAASGVIGTIAGLVKNLGELFKKGSPQESEEKILDNTFDQEDKNSNVKAENISQLAPVTRSAIVPDDDNSLPVTESTDDPSDLPAPTEKSADTPTTEKKGIVKWVSENKVLAFGIGLAVIGGTILTVRAMKKKPKATSRGATVNGLDGIKKRKKPTTTTKKSIKKKVTPKKSTTKRKVKTTSRKKATTQAKRGRTNYRRIELL